MSEDMNILEAICPLRYALDIVGGKWKLPILCILADEKPVRYNAIKKRTAGITNMMLSQSLKELEASGIVSRKQYNEIPPRVEYSLTEEGRKLLPALEQLATWGATHMDKNSKGNAQCHNCRDSA